jgi:hypothetical protein
VVFINAAGGQQCKKNKPNFATTNPSAITVMPDLTHASKVRSAAKKTRGSEFIICPF